MFLDKVSLTDFVLLGFVCLRFFFMLLLPNSGPEIQNDHLWPEKKKKWGKEEGFRIIRNYKNRRILQELCPSPEATSNQDAEIDKKKKKKGQESLT